jgi:hypothetical protein
MSMNHRSRVRTVYYQLETNEPRLKKLVQSQKMMSPDKTLMPTLKNWKFKNHHIETYEKLLQSLKVRISPYKTHENK